MASVSAMLLFHALEHRSAGFILAFAGASLHRSTVSCKAHGLIASAG